MVDRYVRRARRWIWSRTYALGPGRFYRPTYERIAEAVAPHSGRMLDVGTGPGWLCISAARQRPALQVIGIDTSPDMVAASLRNRDGLANCDFSEMNAAEMKYENDTFDVITAMQTVHHWADAAAILREIHRVLAPGASAYIYDADATLDIPAAWLDRIGPFPTDANLRKRWETYSLSDTDWERLKIIATASPFDQVGQDIHGFYRRLVLTKQEASS